MVVLTLVAYYAELLAAQLRAAEHIQAAEHAHAVHADGAVNRTGVGAGHDLAKETAVRPNGGARTGQRRAGRWCGFIGGGGGVWWSCSSIGGGVHLCGRHR